jgi:hypothetical protein
MDLSFALFAETAELARDTGTVDIRNGGFDTIWASQFPATHPSLMVVRLSGVPNGRSHVHRLRLDLVDDQGVSLIDPPVVIEVTVSPATTGVAGRSAHWSIVRLDDLVFPQPGQYALHISIDAQRRTTLPLRVMRVPVGTSSGTVVRSA